LQIDHFLDAAIKLEERSNSRTPHCLIEDGKIFCAQVCDLLIEREVTPSKA
jgi:hypothetical protein